MSTPDTIVSTHFFSEQDNTVTSDGSIFITSFESAGVVAIDDLAVSVSPVHLYSPIRCNRFSSFGVPFTFYYYGKKPAVEFFPDPGILPAELPMFLA